MGVFFDEDDGTQEPPLEAGDVLIYREERVFPLGPVAGSDLVDMQEEVEELHEALRLKLDAEGIGTARTYGRAEWTGVFTYEVEVHLQVVLFFPVGERSAEEVRAASAFAWAVLVVVGLIAVGWTAHSTKDIARHGGKLADSLSIIGVALGLLALAFIVYQIQKSPGAAP